MIARQSLWDPLRYSVSQWSVLTGPAIGERIVVMSLSDVTRDSVLKAIRECDAVGREEFLREYRDSHLIRAGAPRHLRIRTVHNSAHTLEQPLYATQIVQ